jgi:hypothetical protein
MTIASRSSEGKELRQELFIKALQIRGNYASAAIDAGICYETQKGWRKESPDFAATCAAALEVFKGSLMNEIVRRGRDGFEEPVIFQGRVMYKHDPNTGRVMLDDDLEPIPLTVRKHSDPLLASLAESTGVLAGKKGASVTIDGLPDGEAGGDMKVTVKIIRAKDGKRVEDEEPDPLDD